MKEHREVWHGLHRHMYIGKISKMWTETSQKPMAFVRIVDRFADDGELISETFRQSTVFFDREGTAT